jgi:hypothetical protein
MKENRLNQELKPEKFDFFTAKGEFAFVTGL